MATSPSPNVVVGERGEAASHLLPGDECDPNHRDVCRNSRQDVTLRHEAVKRLLATFLRSAKNSSVTVEPAVGTAGCRLRTDLRLSGEIRHLHQPVDVDLTIVSAFTSAAVQRPARVRPDNAHRDALQHLVKPLDDAYMA